MKNIILASKSPRRKELLEQININFTIYTKEVDETYDDNLKADQIVEYLANKKAVSIADDVDEDSIIIAADTIVEINGEILLKPINKEDAVRMLKKLSGKTHVVYTGVCILNKLEDKCYTASVSTEVTMKELTNEEVEFYIYTGEPMDKAGAYGIQGIGSIFINNIAGDYFNVVGLPVKILHEGFKELGLNLLDYIKVDE